jgi:hypothetical protein
VVRILGYLLIALAVVAGAVFYAAGRGFLGRHEGPGEIAGAAVPPELVQARAEAQQGAARALGAGAGKQILFGDLHVHTTFSFDAFQASLPFAGGEGAHPPADACDFARYCSALDFWSINDHAEQLTRRHWDETVESIRRCNAVAGDPANPDVVAFLGWEWTQVGTTPETHYGHKNVVLREEGEGRVPARPIAAQRGLQVGAGPGLRQRAMIALLGGHPRLRDFSRYLAERADLVDCPTGVPVRGLPADCREGAATPAELYEKLRDWGYDALVIPHGTSWGLYTPPGSTWDNQLGRTQHDPELEGLIEIYSGHGSSEEYRSFRAVRFEADGTASCPEPTPEYLPSCWQAGEIIRARCAKAGLDAAECERRAQTARRHHVDARMAGHHTIPGGTVDEWLDAGQCRDCFQPTFNHRPGGSVQYTLAKRDFERAEDPFGPRFGFIASSDNHSARPGTGFKEYARGKTTDGAGGNPNRRALLAQRAAVAEGAPAAESVPFDLENPPPGLGLALLDFERVTSFFVSGGLAAVHAEGRDRDSIFAAFKRKEVYATSGPRILLWFDLVDPATGDRRPMGSSVLVSNTPRFEVRALGSFEQQPGCPDTSTRALSPERLRHLCAGECYHPSDRRRRLSRIEVVRIRPQRAPDEGVEGLIEDPWLVFPCPPAEEGCAFSFEDESFPRQGREILYYARAIEEPSAAINAAGLGCEYDAAGRCVRVAACGLRGAWDDDCLAPTEQRAWSSPIYLAPLPEGHDASGGPYPLVINLQRGRHSRERHGDLPRGRGRGLHQPTRRRGVPPRAGRALSIRRRVAARCRRARR